MLDTFIRQLGTDEAMLFEGAFSPLSILFCWVDQQYYDSWYETPASPLIEAIEGRNATLLFNDTHYAAYAKEVFVKYWNKPAAFAEHFDKCKALSGQIDEHYRRYVLMDVAASSEKELLDAVSSIHRLLAELVSRSVFIELFDKGSVIDAVEGVSQAMVEGVWEKATHPAFESFEARRLKLVIEEYEKQPRSFHKTCQFIYTDYFDSKDEDKAGRALHQIVSEGALAENRQKAAESAAELNERLLAFEAWTRTLSPIEKKLVTYIQLVMEARDWRKDPIAQVQNLLSIFGKELLRRAGVDESCCPYVLASEFEQGIKALQANKEDILARPKGMVAYLGTDGSYQAAAQDISGVKKRMQDVSISHGGGQLKGQIGASGKATGIVKVIKDMAAAGKFLQGDILVTSMTRPEFVPLMKLAGAIVTNEGGITCHAAIVARELKKPCIIGTKVATQVLKDGDLVEVDANAGVIKILN